MNRDMPIKVLITCLISAYEVQNMGIADIIKLTYNIGYHKGTQDNLNKVPETFRQMIEDFNYTDSLSGTKMQIFEEVSEWCNKNGLVCMKSERNKLFIVKAN